MTDDEIRRAVLADAGWEPDEVDRWLAEHPKPTMLAEQLAILHARLGDTGRALWHGREALVIIYAAVALCCVAALMLA